MSTKYHHPKNSENPLQSVPNSRKLMNLIHIYHYAHVTQILSVLIVFYSKKTGIEIITRSHSIILLFCCSSKQKCCV